ncbi:MFS transporter [Amaricoccus sp.]|uniref:MFS transporter n=1 Tax=Amaricoccus sp. TaxID=1872485 RepID=UPI001B3F0C88|nr:MFS transporter [Amaricoccus sp.]MBP7242907.1 MFS transporter [Amaricoccus sp.]
MATDAMTADGGGANRQTVAAPPRVSPKIVAATVAGNALEFFDFTTYAFFAVYIGAAFFPTHDPLVSVMLSVAVFGVGFVTRPLGGVFIGAFADRVGRKPAMLLTIALITVGTMGLALTPSYERIGITAAIIVIICRLIQGFALGGEVGPSSSFLIEIAPPGRRGFYGSWQLASQGIASLAAGIVGLALTLTLTPEQMHAWGWRVPFFLGLGLIPIAVYLRRNMPESLHGEAGEAVKNPLVEIRNHFRPVILSLMLIMGMTISTYAAIYMTTYAITTLKLSAAVGMMATVVFGISTWAGSLIGGWLSDRYGRKPVILWARVAIVVLTIPVFMLLVKAPSIGTLLLASVTLSTLTAISGAPSLVAIPELFPAHVRALGLSIAYAFGVAFFGGTAQLVIT